jgi:hypothetical protein
MPVAAFDYLLRQLPDLILDTPDAADVLGNFMARAIADDCIRQSSSSLTRATSRTRRPSAHSSERPPSSP